MLEERFLSRLDALRPRLVSYARGGAGGVRKSRQLGASAEFSDFREYAPGDDIRRIDWNAYARFDRLFLKLFMEEQESFVTVILDGSASMAEKWPAAIAIGQAYAYAALGGGDRVRVAVAKETGVSSTPFYTGRQDYLKLASFLEESAPGGQIDLTQAIRRFEPLPRGLCLLISDFLYPDEGASALTALGLRGQEACAAQVLSPAELNPALSGAVRLIDGENSPPLPLFLDGEALRRYQETLNRFLSSVRGACHKRGVPYALMNASERVEDVFIRRFLASGMLA